MTNQASLMDHKQRYYFFKRIIDLAVASVLLILFLPIWVLVPLLIYFDSGLPIFFKHKRVGKDGAEFFLFKFRSMIPDAELVLHGKDSALLQQFKASDWKIQNDPRITRIGKALRSLTIDEFPQLFNVLRGEMSMVGPRAYVRRELDEQSTRYPKTKPLIPDILSVKPGITGVWQTSGRNEVPFVKRAEIDAAYAQRHSLIEDFQIMLKTPRAMISKW